MSTAETLYLLECCFHFADEISSAVEFRIHVLLPMVCRFLCKVAEVSDVRKSKVIEQWQRRRRISNATIPGCEAPTKVIASLTPGSVQLGKGIRDGRDFFRNRCMQRRNGDRFGTGMGRICGQYSTKEAVCKTGL